MKPQKSPTGESGFTLLELLVVLTVGTLLITVAAPQLSIAVAHARLRASASRISAALRETRMAAMANSKTVGFSITASGRSYSADDRNFVLPSGETITIKPYGQTTFQSEGELVFQADGSSSGGTIALDSDSRDRIQIDVDWLSGRVRQRE